MGEGVHGRLGGRRAAALAFAIFALGFSAASAHWVYEEGYTWEDPSGSGKCLKVRSEISDGNTDDGGNHGYTKVDMLAVKKQEVSDYVTVDCWANWGRPIGYLKARMLLKVCEQTADCAYGGQWAACKATPWEYNQSQASQFTVDEFWDIDCGTAWYANDGVGKMLWNSTWVGDPLWSGKHLLFDGCYTPETGNVCQAGQQ